jgi:O-antigen/teichoic acid export membrane protein
VSEIGGLTVGAPAAWRQAYRILTGRILGSEFVRQVGETFSTRILLIAVGVLTSVLVSRALGSEGRGLYAVAGVVASIGVQFGCLGLHASNTYAAARDRTLLPSLAGNSLFVGLLLGGVGACLAWVLFQLLPSLAPVHGILLAFALGAVPLGLTYLLIQNLLLGMHEVRVFNLLELGSKVGIVALLVLALLLRRVSAEWLFGATVLGIGVTCVVALILLRRRLVLPPRVVLPLLLEQGRYGLRAYLAALASFLVIRTDLLMVQYLRGSSAAGFYSIAVALADMVYMFPVVVGTILFPKLAAMPDTAGKRRLTGKVARAVGGIMIVVAGVSAVLARPAIRLLFGSEFLPAVPAFLWLLPGIVALSVHTILMNYCAAIGMPWVTVYAPFMALVVNIGLNAILIPRLGIVGASLASLVAYGLMLSVSLTYLLRQRDARRAEQLSR